MIVWYKKHIVKLHFLKNNLKYPPFQSPNHPLLRTLCYFIYFQLTQTRTWKNAYDFCVTYPFIITLPIITMLLNYNICFSKIIMIQITKKYIDTYCSKYISSVFWILELNSLVLMIRKYFQNIGKSSTLNSASSCCSK